MLSGNQCDTRQQYQHAIDALVNIKPDLRTDEDNRKLARLYMEMTYKFVEYVSGEDRRTRIDAYKSVIAALSLVKSRNDNDYMTIARAYLKLGAEYLAENDICEAEKYYQIPLTMSQEIKSETLKETYPLIMLLCHTALGKIYFNFNDDKKAKHHYRQASKLLENYSSRQIDNGSTGLPYTVRDGIIAAETSLAFVYGSMKHWHRAAKHLKKAIHILCGNDDSMLNDKDCMRAAQLHVYLGETYAELKTMPKAVTECARASMLMKRIKNCDEAIYRDMAQCYLQMGDVLITFNDSYALMHYEQAAAMFKKGIYVHLPELVAKIIKGYTTALSGRIFDRDIDNELRASGRHHAMLAFLNTRLHHPLERPDQSEVIRQYKLSIELLNGIRNSTADDRRAIAEAHSSLREIYNDNGKNMKALGEGLHAILNRAAASFSRKNISSPLRSNSMYAQAQSAKTDDAQQTQEKSSRAPS